MAAPEHEVVGLTQAQRRRLAVDLFNHVWTLIDAAERTPEQDLAREAGDAIAEEDDREHFFEALATLPGR